jgi:hypothetical protein
MSLKFDLTLFSIPTTIRLTFTNITSEFSAALSATDGGQLAPIITSVKYNIVGRTLDITNNYWVGWFAAIFVEFLEKLANFLLTDFGVPIANMIIPSVTTIAMKG